MIKIKLFCNWNSCENLIEEFKKYFKQDYLYDNLEFVLSEQDYNVVVNYTYEQIDLSKTILFQWEPESTRRTWPGIFSTPNTKDFLKCYDINNHHNIVCWYLNKTQKQLSSEEIVKSKTFSGIISNLSNLEGHHFRKSFVENHLMKLPYYEHFGRGYVSINDKSEGLYPYKYTFACENSFERNYFTEKIIDSIMSECICFYDGCPNIEDFFNNDCFIKIDVKDPIKSVEIIKRSIGNDEYEKRIKNVRLEKKRILEEFNWIESVKTALLNIKNGEIT